ncbi:hypothetical protein LZ31DRAFT_560858 [Colletotrichum somersetense]|nr:hypothetical protein LZ31DRAFT_560858 [Colletotrichum somersetense]
MAHSERDTPLDYDSGMLQSAPLLETLDELNKIDIIQIEEHIDQLWDKLHANFAETRDSSITGGASFIVWALNKVARPLLCRILDREHKAVLQSITPDMLGRLTSLADRWDASPGLLLDLFSHKIVSSRACIDLLNSLRKASPDHYINSTNGGVLPNSSPNVVWSPVGGPHGTIVVSSYTAPLFINRRGGDHDAWVAYDSPESAAYTRNLRIFEEDPDYLLIMGAGVLPPSTTNKVTVSVLKLTELLDLKQV